MKSSFVILLLVVAVAQAEKQQSCKPNTQWKQACNTCSCAEDGINFICTLMACDPNRWNFDGTEKNPNQGVKIEKRSTDIEKPEVERRQLCTPNTQWKQYCNICFCAEDGINMGCTLMACDTNRWNYDGTEKNPYGGLKIEKRSTVIKKRELQVCLPNTSWKEKCNTCFCTDDGKNIGCTLMGCDPAWNLDGSENNPNENVKIEKRSITTHKSAYDRDCVPGKSFKYYCNTCTCSRFGRVGRCTRMLCDENNFNEDGSIKIKGQKDMKCNPGESYRPDACNTCICNEYGTGAICTTKNCAVNLIDTQFNDETILWGPLYRQGQRCTPGELFFSECNKCICGRNGRNALCTTEIC